MVKHTQICLSLFGHFVGLALKELIINVRSTINFSSIFFWNWVLNLEFLQLKPWSILLYAESSAYLWVRFPHALPSSSSAETLLFKPFHATGLYLYSRRKTKWANFMPLVSYYTPWKYQKIGGFLIISGAKERYQRYEIG